MKFENQIERIKMLDLLINKKSTGCPSSLASRLGLKRSTLYEYIDYLKAIGLNVSYSRKWRTFYYSSNKKLEIHFSVKVVDDSELNELNGGYSYHFTSSDFFRLSGFTFTS